MVERTDPLSDTLKAASDPTRRAILALLSRQGAMRVTDVAGRFDVSLNAVSKHIKVLERAGLVRRRTAWREHLIEAEMAPLAEIEGWAGDLKAMWEARLDRIEAALGEEEDDG